MKALKIVLFSILALLVIVYLAFLFVLPYAVDLNQYSPQITKLIQDNTGFQVELKGLKVKTSWNLSAGASIDKTDLKYTTGEKFAQINNLQIKLSIIPLFFKQIRVDKIDADKVLANIDTHKEGTGNRKQETGKRTPFSLSTNLPAISVKKYRISFLDGEKNYTLKGENLKISDFVLNKKIKLKANGNLILNGRKQIAYNVSIFSKVFPENKKGNFDFIKIFDDLYKYNVNANIDTDLKIQDNSNINGKIDLDKISFTFGGKNFPQSSLKLAFKGDKAKINSSLHVDKNSKVIASGIFKTGKHKYIDLQVLSDEVNLKDVMLITKTMSKPLGIKNIHNIDANGLLSANFSIKSDFKKIKSNGYLKIKNANVTSKLYDNSLNSLNADIDFSQDSVKIKQATAKLDSQPITISGNIDKNANANISVFAKNLQLKSILLTSGNTKILKENDILSGEANITALLKGRLDKATPQINIIINNVNLRNKPTKTQIKLPQIVVNTNLNEKDLVIDKTPLYINDIKTIISGKISTINSNLRLNPLNISVPNQVSIPIKGYAGSTILLSGNLALSGDLYNPQIQGLINIPLIKIPSNFTVLKNTTIQFNKKISLSCQKMQINNFLINNVTSEVTLKNNILHFNNLMADAYFGKIGGNVSYNLNDKKTTLALQGRGLSANQTLKGISGRDDDIRGQLDFDSNLSIAGFSKKEVIRSLKGNTKFIISNGRMGVLGKFEHLLYAQNILSNNVFKTTLNAVVKAITVKDTGVYKYMKGEINFSNGWANIKWIKTSGPSMSLYITGRYYLPDNTANLIMLGRISDDVVRILGPIGEFSMNKAISYIPKIGEITAFFASQFTTNPSYENTSQIPYLTPKTEFPTKEFKVVIDGNAQSQSSVKSFKWLSKPSVAQPQASQYSSAPTQAPINSAHEIPTQAIPATKIPDFVKKLPDLQK